MNPLEEKTELEEKIEQEQKREKKKFWTRLVAAGRCSAQPMTTS